MHGQVIKERYRIDKIIGRGGMAMVYRAFDMVLSRAVAIKILHARFTDNAHFVERFKREAHAAASLVQRNITTIYDTGFANGVYFIVMEYVKGKTLKQMIDERAPLLTTEATDIARQVTEALSHAHSRGIIHRDIKPQNILVTEDRIVKVTDFGIARALAMPGLTQTGKVLGTARYISPEQARGQQADHRSDIYALGVIFYEMVTGRAPFEGSSSVEVARQHITDAPRPVRELNPKVPPALEIVIDKMLKKNPQERYQEADKLLDDLSYWESQEHRDLMLASLPSRAEIRKRDESQRRQRRRRKRRLTRFAKGLIAMSAVSVIAFAGLYLAGGEQEAPMSRPAASGAGEAAPVAAVRKERVGVLKPIEVVDYDPAGNGDENPGDVARVVDGDEDTAWSTEGYRSASFGGLKDGIGVYLDYGDDVEVQRMVVLSSGGWSGAIKGSDDVLNWKTVREVDDADNELSLDLSNGKHYRYYLIWVTRLPSRGPGSYGCRIFEVTARGRMF